MMLARLFEDLRSGKRKHGHARQDRKAESAKAADPILFVTGNDRYFKMWNNDET